MTPPPVREALEAIARILGEPDAVANENTMFRTIVNARAALAAQRDAGEGDLREELQRVKRIAAHVPPLVWIQAKEHAGYADAVHPAARDGERGETRPHVHLRDGDCDCYYTHLKPAPPPVEAVEEVERAREHFAKLRRWLGGLDYDPASPKFHEAHLAMEHGTVLVRALDAALRARSGRT